MARRGGTKVAASGGAVLLALAALTGCSGQAQEAVSSATASASAAVKAMADLMFARMMIPHHEQAVEMSDLALDAKAQASTEIQALAERIKAAQAPEIEQMRAWLKSWGVPEMMDHSGHAMAGMLSQQELDALATATGAEFDKLWLEGMIAHHEGALAMVKPVLESANAQVKQLAENIRTSQQAEITEMRGLLQGS